MRCSPGRTSRSAWRTVSPPTPESKIPIAPSGELIAAPYPPWRGTPQATARAASRTPCSAEGAIRDGVAPRADDPPQLGPSLPGTRREANEGDVRREPVAQAGDRRPGCVSAELVELGRDDDRPPPQPPRHIAQKVILIVLDAAADVDHDQNAHQRRTLCEVRLDQRSPGAPLRLGPDREPVAREVDEHEGVVHEEEVQLPRPSRRRADARQPAPSNERVDQRRLADVRPPRDRDLGQAGRWPPAGRRRGTEEAGFRARPQSSASRTWRLSRPRASPASGRGR